MRRLLPLLAVLAAGLAMLAASAVSADSGSTPDPDDVAGPVDVRTASHADSGSNVTLSISTAPGTFTADDLDFVFWKLDFDGDGTPDACITANSDGTSVTGQFEDYDTGASDCDVTAVSGTSVAISFTDGSSTLSATVSRADMQTVGLSSGASSYRYNVEAAGFDSAAASTLDLVPDAPTEFITHTFTPTATPTVTPTATIPASTQSVASVQPASGARGARITVAGSGCAAGVSSVVLFDATPIGSATSDAAGNVSTVVTVPSGAAAGLHSITITCQNASGVTHRAVGSFSVIAGSIPAAGDEPVKPLVAGLALLLGMFVAGSAAALLRKRHA